MRCFWEYRSSFTTLPKPASTKYRYTMSDLRHDSCTWSKTEGGKHNRSAQKKLERSHVRLEFGRHLLQTRDRQAVSNSEVGLVGPIMLATNSCPLASWLPSAVFSSSAKATKFAHKKKRRKGGHPPQPLFGIGSEEEFSPLPAHRHQSV